MMKKTTFGAILAFLFLAAGALTAAALYLRRREKELDEYEQLLYSDDGGDEPEEAEEEPEYTSVSTEPADAPAQDEEPTAE